MPVHGYLDIKYDTICTDIESPAPNVNSTATAVTQIHAFLFRVGFSPLTKWDLVESIRAEPDITAKEELYSAFYPMYSNKEKKPPAPGDKKTWGYTKRIKKPNSSMADIILSDIPELDLS